MDNKQLQYFLVIAEERSFSKAAERLYVSQQALSKSIEKLESELTCILFERKRTGLELTKYGKKLQMSALPYLKMHDNIVYEIQNMKNDKLMKLSIGYANGLLENFPSGFLSDFIKSHPHIDFYAYSFPDDTYNRSLQESKIDIFLSTMTFNLSAYNIEYSCKRKIYAVMSTENELVNKKYITLDDLKNQKSLFSNAENALSKKMEEICVQHEIKPSIYISPAEGNLFLELITRNNFISFFGGDPKLLPDTMVRKEIVDLDLYYELFIITKKGEAVTPVMREFIHYCEKYI